MGIKGFSKKFAAKHITSKDIKGMTGAFDASVILYQSCLGMSSIKGLTDACGNPTLHINVIIAKILNFIKNSVRQIWVLDYSEHGYMPPDKEIELERRRNIKAAARQKLDELKTAKDAKAASKSDELFSDSDDEIEKKISQQEKINFSVNDQIINDCKFILDCFDICWCVAPKGFEAEQICAEFTKTDIKTIRCDFVYSTDVDALLYGASKLVRDIKIKNKKVLQLYESAEIFEEYDINLHDLQIIGVALGCDHAPKTPKIGPKTVLQKFRNITLTEPQENAIKVFNRTIDIKTIEIHNIGSANIASDSLKINKLLEWLELKNFNRARIVAQIHKVRPDLNL